MNGKTRKLWAQHLDGNKKSVQKMDTKALLRKVPYKGRILGVDPSLRGTGLAVLDCDGSTHRLLHSETLKFNTKISSISCLGKIHQSVAQLIDLWKPGIYPVRKPFMCRTSRPLKLWALPAALPYPLPRFGRFPFLSTLLSGLNKRWLDSDGRAKSKCHKPLLKCFLCLNLFPTTSPMLWGWHFATPLPGLRTNKIPSCSLTGLFEQCGGEEKAVPGSIPLLD